MKEGGSGNTEFVFDSRGSRDGAFLGGSVVDCGSYASTCGDGVAVDGHGFGRCDECGDVCDFGCVDEFFDGVGGGHLFEDCFDR